MPSNCLRFSGKWKYIFSTQIRRHHCFTGGIHSRRLGAILSIVVAPSFHCNKRTLQFYGKNYIPFCYFLFLHEFSCSFSTNIYTPFRYIDCLYPYTLRCFGWAYIHSSYLYCCAADVYICISVSIFVRLLNWDY